jgi:hypothetical protein
MVFKICFIYEAMMTAMLIVMMVIIIVSDMVEGDMTVIIRIACWIVMLVIVLKVRMDQVRMIRVVLTVSV